MKVEGLATSEHRDFAMSHGGYTIIWVGNTWEGQPMRDMVVFADGTAIYDEAARKFADEEMRSAYSNTQA